MKLYLMKLPEYLGYDSYDAVVVSAKSEDDARTIHPCDFVTHVADGKWMGTYEGKKSGEEYEREDANEWPIYSDISKINVEYLGDTHKKRGVILASFNAG